MPHRSDTRTTAPASPQRRRMAGAMAAMLLGTSSLGAIAADEPYVVLVDGENRQALLNTMAEALRQSGNYKVRMLAQQPGWVEEAMDLALQNPTLVVAHVGMLPDGKSIDQDAQERLLRSMFDMNEQSPRTRFLLWNAAFDKIGAAQAQAQIQAAAVRIMKTDGFPASAAAPLGARIQVMVLPKRLDETSDGSAMGPFTNAVAKAVARR